jgi:23S rRNA U2552 (ribose-2'-O)-methylase RlmE/FtsJ
MIKRYPLNLICNGYDEFKDIVYKNEQLKNTLCITKNLINNQKKWDMAKKFTNEYEFIFSFNNEGVADIHPISRSYFKMIEILIDKNILPKDTNIKSFNTFCLCEGPGGFVQAINDISYKHHYNLPPINCITLISKEKKIPNWKLQQLNNYKIHFGKDGTGDIYNIENIDDVVSKIGFHNVQLITADGGFDFSANFNLQELEFQQLLISEIYIAILLQKHNGIFILKVYDLFDLNTIRLISVLHKFYQVVEIFKPKSSRPANSEKYIICNQFIVENCSNNILSNLRKCVIHKNLVYLDHILDSSFIEQIYRSVYQYNIMYVNNQISYIKNTLNIIKNNNFYDKKQYIEKCKSWCLEYGIPVKEDLITTFI